METQRNVPYSKLKGILVSNDKEPDLVPEWKQSAEAMLGEAYLLEAAIASISRGYYDGMPLLFPDISQDSKRLVEHVERLVAIFNEGIAGSGSDNRVDLDAVRKRAFKTMAGEATKLVDLSKADALEEMGDREASIELAGRYL